MDNIKKFLNMLFVQEDGVCYGNKFSNAVTIYNSEKKYSHEFYCINPLHNRIDFGYLRSDKYDKLTPRRADINVSKFKTFMFEMDSTKLEDQLNILLNCGINWTGIVYSGNKSYHAVLSLKNPLDVNYHTFSGIEDYKNIWKRIQAYIDEYAKSNGYDLPNGKNTFIDNSSINPSRLSRFPGFKRSNGNNQELVYIGQELNDINELLKKCPKVDIKKNIQLYDNKYRSENIYQFLALCPQGLYTMLRFPNWAAPEGCYPILFRLALWSIDSTGVTQEILIEFMEKYTFPKLLENGYPEHKLYTAIEHAYRLKGFE